MRRRSSQSGSTFSCRSILPGLAAVLLALLSPPAPAADTPNEPTRVAVLDVTRVLDELLSWQATLEQFTAREAEIRAAVAAEDKELTRLEGELRYFKPGSDDHTQREAEIADRARRLARRVERLQREIAEQSRAELEAARRAVAAAAADYAAANGVDLVLDARTVIYAEGALDISAEVALGMNKRYKERHSKREFAPEEDE